MHFAVYSAHASIHFLSLRMHLCTSLHLPYACPYAFLCLRVLRMPHASMHFTVHSPYALCLRMPLRISLFTFPLCSRSCGDVLRVLLYKLRLCSRSSGDVLRALLSYLKVATLQPDPCRRSRTDREDMPRFTRDHSESDLRYAQSLHRAVRELRRFAREHIARATWHARPTQRVRKNRKKLQFLHLDHADPRRGSRRQVEKHKTTLVFAHRPGRSLRGSYLRRVLLVPPRRLKILILRKRASFLVQVMLV